MTTNQPRARVSAFVALGLLVVASAIGCATAPSGGPTQIPGPTSSVPAPLVEISEQANHSSLVLRTGQTVALTLHNLYWSDPSSTAPGVLAAEGPANRTRGGQCPVGSGCGSVSGRFTATKAGTAQLQAHRTSCGEAKPCATDQRDFTVTVTVE